MPLAGQSSNQSFDQYIQTVRRDKKVTPSAVDTTHRRRVGVLLGGVSGLIYGLVSQTINLLANPGIPLHQPPLGPVGNTLLLTAAGAMIGLAAAWPRNALRGATLGAVVGAALLLLRARLVPDTMPLLGRMDQVFSTLMDVLAIPVAFLIMLPAGLILRWAVDSECERSRQPLLTWKRIRLPLVLFAVVALLGTMGRYPADVHDHLAAMNSLVQAGQAARSGAELPAALRRQQVANFLLYGQDAYALEWEAGQVSRISESGALTEGTGPSQPRTVIAHFENGYIVSCTFARLGAEPRCRSSQ